MARCADKPRGLSGGQKRGSLEPEALTEVKATIGASLSNTLAFSDDSGRSRSIYSDNGIYCTVSVEMQEQGPRYLQLYTLAGIKTSWALRITVSTTGG